jgi:RNA polymerase sigma-70 factor, ECF subfamily
MLRSPRRIIKRAFSPFSICPGGIYIAAMGEQMRQKDVRDSAKLYSQETQDDDALMVAISSGDVSALGVIYNRYSKLLFPWCRRILRDELAAEEVLQDVFCELWTIPNRFDPARGSLIIYLTHLTRSRAIDRWRKDRRLRRKCCTNLEISSVIAPVSNMKNEPPRMVELFEQIGRMKRALNQLSALQRLPIELSFLDGLSHTEIAQVLAIPLGTIKARIRSGLILLRNAFQRNTTDDEETFLDLHPSDYISSSLT